MGTYAERGFHHHHRPGQHARPPCAAPTDAAPLQPVEPAVRSRLPHQRAAVPRPLLARCRHRAHAGRERRRHPVVALGRGGCRTSRDPRRARRSRVHRAARPRGRAARGTGRARRARQRLASFSHPAAPRAARPVHLLPPRRATVSQPPLRRRRAQSPPRRVRQATAAEQRTRADLPARRRVPDRQQDARCPATRVPARESGLALRECELPSSRHARRTGIR